MSKHDPVIIAAARSPLCRAQKGAFRLTRIDDVAAQVLRRLVASIAGLVPGDIEDVIVGCAMPEGEQGYNVARQIALLAGLPVETAALTVNRFCASSLEALHIAATKIMAGQGEIFVAGGIESMSHVPIGGFNPSFNEKLMRDNVPDAYISMGATAENVAKHYAISREEQDRFALASHRKACAAQAKKIFDGEIIPTEILCDDGTSSVILHDENPRADTSIEALMNLSPSFAEDGTVTAGNSSPLTDGVAFAVVTSRWRAKSLGVHPLARIRSFAVVGCDPATMGMGPLKTVPVALKRAKMSLKDIKLIELNEAFAAQAIAVMRELNLDEHITNVHGGAVALGHPLGATGMRMVATGLNAMQVHGAENCLVTMCVGGGQGVALILEQL